VGAPEPIKKLTDTVLGAMEVALPMTILRYQ